MEIFHARRGKPETTPQILREVPAAKTTDDPLDFLNQFRKSEVYTEGYSTYKEGKNATDEELVAIFERKESTRTALINFAQNTLHYKYNPDYFTPTSREAIDKYIEYVKSNFPAVGDIDNIVNLDNQRSSYHALLGKTLTSDGITPNVEMGRVIGRLILISEGIDTYGSARQSTTFENITRSLGNSF